MRPAAFCLRNWVKGPKGIAPDRNGEQERLVFLNQIKARPWQSAGKGCWPAGAGAGKCRGSRPGASASGAGSGEPSSQAWSAGEVSTRPAHPPPCASSRARQAAAADKVTWKPCVSAQVAGHGFGLLFWNCSEAAGRKGGPA